MLKCIAEMESRVTQVILSIDIRSLFEQQLADSFVVVLAAYMEQCVSTVAVVFVVDKMSMVSAIAQELMNTRMVVVSY